MRGAEIYRAAENNLIAHLVAFGSYNNAKRGAETCRRCIACGTEAPWTGTSALACPALLVHHGPVANQGKGGGVKSTWRAAWRLARMNALCTLFSTHAPGLALAAVELTDARRALPPLPAWRFKAWGGYKRGKRIA